MQRLCQWFNNRGKQSKKTPATYMNKTKKTKPLGKRQVLQLWQAYSVMNREAVRMRVHAKYPLYIAEVLEKCEKVMERLIFVKKDVLGDV